MAGELLTHGHIAGLIPAARGPMSPEMMTALAERHTLMESRAAVLALNAVGADASWLKRLGTPPVSDADRRRWLNEVRTVAAYRDRYQVDGRSALGEVRHTVQNFDVARARQAIRRARAIADDADRTQNGGDLSIDRQRRALV